MNRILLFFLLLAPLSSFATHIVGGEMQYTHMGGDEYQVTLIIYRDCGPTNTNGTYFDALASVGIYRDGVIFQNLLMNLNDADVSELPVAVDNPCAVLPPDVCVDRAVYVETVTLPAWPTGYTLTHQRCCRNPSIINIQMPEETGATFWTQIPGTDLVSSNSNPVFTAIPPVALCAGDEFVFDHSAFDADGDQLLYSFCTPLLGGSFFEPTPSPPPPAPYTDITWAAGFSNDNQITADPAFVIDPVTGIIVGTPTEPGQYVFGICVEEYRDGVLLSTTNRDFQMNVVACGLTTVSSIQTSPPCSGLDIPFGNNSFGGEEFSWDFGVEDIDTDVSNEFEPEYTYPDTGTYEVTLIVNPGTECADTSLQTIYAYDTIEALFEVSGGECVGGGREFFIDAQSTTFNGVDFFWDFGNANPATSVEEDPGSVILLDPGEQSITLILNFLECESSLEVPLDVEPFPVAIIEEQDNFCGGLELTLGNNSTNATDYFWFFGHQEPNSTAAEESPTHTWPDYGTYYVTLIADPGTACADSLVTPIEILPPDPIDLLYSIQVPGPCDEDTEVSLLYAGSGADEIEWDMGDGSFYETDQVDHEYENSGEYTVIITAYNTLCDFEETAESTVYYDPDVLDLPLALPNVFSPNGDSKNEFYRPYFEVELGEPFTDYTNNRNVFDYLEVWEILIYNRWGALVYDSTGGTEQWDGRIAGDLASEGTYYAVITYQRKCLDSAPIQTGQHFSLMR